MERFSELAMVEDDADEDRMMLVKGEIGDPINGGAAQRVRSEPRATRKQEAFSDLCNSGGIALEF